MQELEITDQPTAPWGRGNTDLIHKAKQHTSKTTPTNGQQPRPTYTTNISHNPNHCPRLHRCQTQHSLHCESQPNTITWIFNSTRRDKEKDPRPTDSQNQR